MQFRTKYNYEPSAGEVFHHVEGIAPDKVNRAGFVPIKDRLAMMQMAGQTLQDVRESQYPADEAENIVLPLYSDKLSLVDEFREATRERVEAYKVLQKEAMQKVQEEQKAFEEFRKNPPKKEGDSQSPVSPLDANRTTDTKSVKKQTEE